MDSNERPGVTIRGGRGLDELGLHLYSLSDVEEDEADHPAKQYQTFGSIYTYTNSTVMHPDDGMSVTSSLPQSQMSSKCHSISSSRQPRYVFHSWHIYAFQPTVSNRAEKIFTT